MLRDPYGTVERLHDRYGPVVRFGMWPVSYVGMFGRDANELVLSTAHDAFTWREALRSLIEIDGDTALVVTDGEEHDRRRKLVQPAFATRRINGYVPIMVEECDAAIASWRGGTDVDAYESFKSALQRITIRSLFGDELAERADIIGEVLEPAFEFVDSPMAQLPGAPGHGKARRARAEADRIVRAEIARRRDDPDRPDILAALLASELSEQEVLDQVVSLIAAGYGTTSAAIGWGVWRTLREPGVADRIRDEVGDTEPTAELLQREWPYLRGVVNETLRLHPPAFIGGRFSQRSVELAGHTIPARKMVVYSPLVTHRRADLWPEPMAFRPERWLDGFEPAPYSFVPFGGGYRRCIGFAMATLEIQVALARLVQRAPSAALVTTSTPKAKGIGAMYPAEVRVRV